MSEIHSKLFFYFKILQIFKSTNKMFVEGIVLNSVVCFKHIILFLHRAVQM